MPLSAGFALSTVTGAILLGRTVAQVIERNMQDPQVVAGDRCDGGALDTWRAVFVSHRVHDDGRPVAGSGDGKLGRNQQVPRSGLADLRGGASS